MSYLNVTGVSNAANAARVEGTKCGSWLLGFNRRRIKKHDLRFEKGRPQATRESSFKPLHSVNQTYLCVPVEQD